MAALTAQTPAITGTAPTYATAAVGGDTVTPDDYGFLIVKNAGGTVCTVTVVDPRSVNETGQANPDPTVTVPITTGERWIGPLSSAYAASATGLVNITYSQVTSVTVAYVTVEH
jgi:hypothetical protein